MSNKGPELSVNPNAVSRPTEEAPSSPSSPDGAAPGITEGSKDYIIGNYRLDRTIGQGTYGKVKLGIHLQTREKVAVKIIEKSQIQSSKQVARLQREIRFLKLLHHPHIVKVYDVMETNDFIYIIMEYAIGGELFDYIVAHKRVKEKEARSFFRMVLSAVDYCHQNAVIHRDLKPENLLLDDKKCIKIIDFGFGNNFTVNGLLDTFCGSPFYAAPEMITGKKYEGPEVDMWSLGVILFALLCGHLPFDDDNMKELYAKIRTGSYKAPDYLLPNARHLIKRLITVDPKQRATLQEVMNHPWVNEGYDGPPPNYLPERPFIKNPEELSKDIVSRLLIFGYKIEEVNEAFSPNQDYALPNPIRATYFLLSEMVAREQARLRLERRKLSTAQLGDPTSNSPKPSGNQSLRNKSPSILALGKSLPCIDEDSKSPTSNTKSATLGVPAEHISPGTTTPNDTLAARQQQQGYPQHRNVSEAIAAASAGTRRASTPDGYAANRPTGPSKLPSFFGGYGKQTHSDARLLPPLPTKQPLAGSENQQGSSQQPPQASPFARRGSVPLNMMGDSRTDVAGSQPLSRRGSAVGKLKEDIKAVSTWLLSVSTTTNKAPETVLNQLLTILKENKAEWHTEGPFSIVCLVDIATFLPGKDLHTSSHQSQSNSTYTQSQIGQDIQDITTEAQDTVSEDFAMSIEDTSMNKSVEPMSPTSPMSPTYSVRSEDSKGFGFRTGKAGLVSFQVDIVKVQKLNMHGIHFKRISGGVWNYKKVCNRLLGQLSL